MNKKILISLSVIATVAALAIGATRAYFSDVETSTGNTFTAGTIDISVNDQNPWIQKFTMKDMKPSYTDYINFKIQNFGSAPNPVDVYKHLIIDKEETGAQTEPECTEEEGTWDNSTKKCTNMQKPNDKISEAILYDLYVKVSNSQGKLIWWQAIYTEDVTVAQIACKDIYLGMIPAGGWMEVKQSYHMNKDTTNWAQGDIMTFSIEVKAEQIQGNAVLENKTLPDGGQGPWKIVHDDIHGTLTYKVKNPTFDFSFSGKAPLGSTKYVLAAGMKSTATGYDVDTYLGEGTSESDGTILFSGNKDLGKDMKDVKVWLVPETYWDDSAKEVKWTNWPSMVSEFLWETGLIWYDDTDVI